MLPPTTHVQRDGRTRLSVLLRPDDATCGCCDWDRDSYCRTATNHVPRAARLQFRPPPTQVYRRRRPQTQVYRRRRVRPSDRRVRPSDRRKPVKIPWPTMTRTQAFTLTAISSTISASRQVCDSMPGCHTTPLVTGYGFSTDNLRPP